MDVIRATVSGMAITIGGIEAYGVRAKAFAFEGVIEGLKVAETAARKLISADDHTLALLALMGHPYAAAHPNPPHEDPVVHAQSGAYLAALRVTPPTGLSDAILAGAITIDEPLAQLDTMLQDGTSKMTARPWMRYVMDTYGQDIADLITAVIDAGLAEAAAG